MSGRDSVFLRALGDEAAQLRPEVLEYVSGPPEGHAIGIGEGVFAVAGSPYRRLAGLLRLMVGPGVALTAYERDVPFTIRNLPSSEGGALSLAAEREFRFGSGAQRFLDTLRVGAVPGTLVNVPGAHGRIEILLSCSATEAGDLLLRSRAARLRLGNRRIRLPRLLAVRLEAVDGWDAERERRTIDVRVRSPLLGTVMRYRGWFRYRYA